VNGGKGSPNLFYPDLRKSEAVYHVTWHITSLQSNSVKNVEIFCTDSKMKFCVEQHLTFGTLYIKIIGSNLKE